MLVSHCFFNTISAISVEKYAFGLNGSYSIDNSPGGYLETFKRISQLEPNIKWNLGLENHNFIPTKSALAFSGSNQNLAENISTRNLVATGETHFHSYWGPINKNMEHISFDANLMCWILNEINGIKMPPPVQYSVSNPDVVCNNNTATFTLNTLPEGATVSWSHNSSFFFSNPTGQGTRNYVVRARSNVRGEAWVRATISTPCGNTTIERKIWVGPPNPPTGITFKPTPCACIGYAVDATAISNNTSLAQGNYNWTINPYHNYHVMNSDGSKIRFAINSQQAHNIGFSVNASNSCGTSPNYNYTLSVNTCDCSHNPGENTGHLDVNPNPTRYSLNVSEKEPTNSNIPWVLRIMGQNGVVYIVVTSQLPETIDVSNLQPGIYILHARRGSYTEQHQIIIN